MWRAGIAVVLMVIFLATMGAAQDFAGVVEAMPQGGHLGEWLISGVPVYVTPDTKLKFKHWPPYVGASVKVVMVARPEGYVAKKIKEKGA